jgi:hypothetical protein
LGHFNTVLQLPIYSIFPLASQLGVILIEDRKFPSFWEEVPYMGKNQPNMIKIDCEEIDKSNGQLDS